MLYDELTQPGSYICHHGVKGQKWGVRHDRQKTGIKKKVKKQVTKIKKTLNKQVTSKKTDDVIKTATMALGAAAAVTALAAIGASPALSFSSAVVEGGRRAVEYIVGTRGDTIVRSSIQDFGRVTRPSYGKPVIIKHSEE